MTEVLFLLLDGFGKCFALPNILAMLGGTCLGIVIGALPGLSGTTGMALLLPITFGFSAQASLLTLAGIFCGAVYGGSISAILVGIPGTAAALPTTFDGFPMAKKGKTSEALLYALYASVFGGVASSLVLMFLTPFIAFWALKFGAPEIFGLTLWGMSVVSGVMGKDVIKGLISGVLGLLVSTVGADPVSGYNRLTFDSYYLAGGFEFVPLVLGALAVPRVFEMIEKIRQEKVYYKTATTRRWFLTIKEILKHWVILFKSATIGVIVGIAPAAGPTIAAFLGYNEAKRSSRNPALFGTGIPEGITSCEASNNAATGGSLVLALSLGIPGCAASAVFIGALIMKGVQPGPNLLQNNAETLYTFFTGFLLINLLILIVGHFFVQIGFSIIRTPLKILAPTIFLFCVVGAFSSQNDMFNVYVMVVSGLIAYILNKLNFEMAPFLLALILGPIMEANFWVSLRISYNDYFIFFKRPLSLIIMIMAIFTLMAPVFISRKKNRE